MEQPGLEPMPIWDTGIAGGSLTCYTTMLAPNKWFLELDRCSFWSWLCHLALAR